VVIMFRKIIDFIRWLLSPERLPPSPEDDQRVVYRQKSFLQWFLGIEQLPKDELGEMDIPRPRGIMRWILTRETLEAEAVPKPPDRSGFIRWLLSREQIPREESGEMDIPRLRGFLRWILTRETLEVEVAPKALKRPGFIRWVLSREKLGGPTNSDAR